MSYGPRKLLRACQITTSAVYGDIRQVFSSSTRCSCPKTKALLEFFQNGASICMLHPVLDLPLLLSSSSFSLFTRTMLCKLVLEIFLVHALIFVYGGVSTEKNSKGLEEYFLVSRIINTFDCGTNKDGLWVGLFHTYTRSNDAILSTSISYSGWYDVGKWYFDQGPPSTYSVGFPYASLEYVG